LTGLEVFLTVMVIGEAAALAVIARRVLVLEERLAGRGESEPDFRTAMGAVVEPIEASVDDEIPGPKVEFLEESSLPPAHEIRSGPPPVKPAQRRAQPVAAWVAKCRQEVLIEALLDEWTDACVAASEIGWVLGIPTGDTLLAAWARAVGGAEISDPPSSFATWFVGEIGKSSRRGLTSRVIVEQRDSASRALLTSAGRLLMGLSEDLQLEPRSPAGVGPKHRHEWLVDTEISATIGNPIVADIVQPLVVLRPLLMRGALVLIEGEVA